MYQVLGYFLSNLNAATPTDLVAIPDTSFSARGGSTGANHWIFTENYDLQGVGAFAAALAGAQLFDATLNAINIPQVYPGNKAITPPSNPNLMDWRLNPQPLPMNEEIAFNANNAAGGAEPAYGLIWITPSNQGDLRGNMVKATIQLPRVFALVTATVVLTAGSWSPFANITFTNPIKGGAYQLNGAHWVVPNGLAYKINFVKAPLYQGRKMFPGNLTEAAYSNVPWRGGINWLGPMGRFNNFELPQLSVLGSTTTGSTTYTGYLDLTYLGNVGADAQP